MMRGLPFVGPAGEMLDRWNRLVGRPRSSLYIDNVVRTQPASNKFEAHDSALVAEHVAALQARIVEHKPKLVLAFGNEAFRAVMGVSPYDEGTLPKIKEARGFLFDSPLGPRVMPVLHPAFFLHQHSEDAEWSAEGERKKGSEWVPWWQLTQLDMKKAVREMRMGCPPLPARNVQMVSSLEEGEMLRVAVRHATRLAVDIENGRDLTLSCLGVAVSPHFAYVIPAEAEWQLALIREVCESPLPKDLQNGKYDRYLLRRYYGMEVRNQTRDAMFAWHALQPELAGAVTEKRKGRYNRRSVKSLSVLASVWTRDTHWKNYDFADKMEQYMLCGADCCITMECCDAMEPHLEAA